MYLCICNCLKEKDVCSVAQGAKSVSEVYKKLGCQPQCGKCVSFVRERYLSKSTQTSAVAN